MSIQDGPNSSKTLGLNRLLFHFILLLTSQIAVVLAIVVLLSLMWGSGQIYQPASLEGRLAVNMPVNDVERSLAVPPGSLVDKMEVIDKHRLAVSLARSGIGSWFIPQYTVSLTFDHEQKLQQCLVEMNWRTDEINVPFSID